MIWRRTSWVLCLLASCTARQPHDRPGAGEPCAQVDCGSGLVCANDVCRHPCVDERDCTGYETCTDGACVTVGGDSGSSGSATVVEREVLTHPGGGEPGDRFGDAVDIDGDWLVIGAPIDDAELGSAFVYHRDGDTWSHHQTLRPVAVQTGVHRFGEDVAIDDDTIVVGADGEGLEALYVFELVGMTWTEGPTLTPSSATSVSFGNRVAVSGDRIAAGAVVEDAMDGALYVFWDDGVGWAEEQRLPSPEPGLATRFGYSPNLLGDRLTAGGLDGGVFVYRRQGGWILQPTIVIAGNQPGDRLSQCQRQTVVDELFLAAHLDDGGDGDPVPNAGVLYNLRWTGSDWQVAATLRQIHPEAQFGNGCSATDSVLAIGAPGEGAGGTVYLYWRDPGGPWDLAQRYVPDDLATGDWFSSRVAASGDTVVFGVELALSGAGKVYVVDVVH